MTARLGRFLFCYPRLWTAALAVLVPVGPACTPSGGASISVIVQAPPPLDTQGACPLDAPEAPLRRGPDGPTTLRLTYRRSGGLLVCDAVVPLDGPKRLVGVPKGEGELPPVDIVVEAFRGDAQVGAVLTGSGTAYGVDLGAGGTANVMVTPRDQLACGQRPLARGRAFHSVTTLPDGDVLIVGGLVASPSDPAAEEIVIDAAGGGFYATRSIERYDVETGTLSSLEVAALTPRAFHAAYLLPGSTAEQPQILFVGGVSAPEGERAARVRLGVDPFRLVPAVNATLAPTEILRLPAGGAPEVVRLDATSVVPRAFAAMSRAASLGDDAALPTSAPPVIAGGVATLPDTFAGTFDTIEDDGTSAGSPAWTLVGPSRAGATVTRMGGGRALIWGGNLSSPAGQEATEIGNVLVGLDGAAPSAAAVTFDAMMGPTPLPRAWHAAAALGPDDVLIAGGFRVGGGATGEPEGPFVERIRFPAGGAAAIIEVVAAVDAKPAGYLEATPLIGGDVLVSGGNPATGVPGATCPDGTISFPLCAVGDVWRFDRETGTMGPVGALAAPRFGHRVAVLRDGTALITGGLQNRGSQLFVVRVLEVFNPRTEAQDAAGDALGDGVAPRKPGDVARDAGGAPLLPCTVVELPETSD